MAVWEYKVISSGKGGFATPALLETFLNQLGKEEWEIIHFQTPPDNALAFQGLARRSTQRDWTLEDAVAAAARAEAEKLRAEFEAKFRGAGSGPAGAASEEKPESLAAQRADSDDGFRKIRDTEHDFDPNASDEEETAPAAAAAEASDWDKLSTEEQLPTFFEAIQPLMRRNPRGAGMSVGVDHLAKKWGLSEDDVMGALKECGFAIPKDEDDDPDYIEYDGDLFWVNVNRRGELWVNTKEKPRQIFKAVKGQRLAPEPKADEASAEAGPAEVAADSSAGAEQPVETVRTVAPEDNGGGRPDRGQGRERGGRGERVERDDRGGDNRGGGGRRLPEGQALLQRIKPLMRRDRGGHGSSGSVGFLSRALKCRENELVDAFHAIGLTLPADGQAAGEVTAADHVWSLHKDQRGGIWITDRRQRSGDAGHSADESVSVPAGEESSGPVGFGDTGLTGHGSALSDSEGGSSSAGETPSADSGRAISGEDPAMPPREEAAPVGEVASRAAIELLGLLRSMLKETRAGALAGEVTALAASAGKSAEDLVSQLIGIGLRVPDKPREKAVTLEISGELVSLTRNAKDEVWLNVKPPGGKPKRARRGPISAEAEQGTAE